MKNNTFLLLFFSLLAFQLQAQESISTSGGNATGTGGSVSYSVGQIFYKTNNDANGSVAGGVQQPYEISVVLNTNEAALINLQYSAFPNPATNGLTLTIKNFADQNLQYRLFDINGKILDANAINKSETFIDIAKYANAVYLLNIYTNNKEIKSFKIIKK